MKQNDLTIDDMADLFQALQSKDVGIVEQALHRVMNKAQSKGLTVSELQQSFSEHGFNRTKAFDNWLLEHYLQPTT